MGSSLITLGVLALCCSYGKRHGWDRDCVIGGTVAVVAGILLCIVEYK